MMPMLYVVNLAIVAQVHRMDLPTMVKVVGPYYLMMCVVMAMNLIYGAVLVLVGTRITVIMVKMLVSLAIINVSYNVVHLFGCFDLGCSV